MDPSEVNVDRSLLEEDPGDLYEHAPCGYISTLPNGTIVKVNTTFLEWTGYTRDSLIGKRRFQDLLPIAGKIYFDTHYGPLLLMQGFVKELAFDVVCATGERIPVLLNSTLKNDAAGSPAIVRTTLLDARGRRAYENELLIAKRRAEDAEASLRLLNDTLEDQIAKRTAERDRLWRTAQDILAIGTTAGRFLRCNPAFTAVLGWTEDEVKSMAFTDLVHPDDIEQLHEYVNALAAGKPIRQAVVRRRHKDGSYRWLSWNIVQEGDQLYFVGRDITEEKRQVEALGRAEDALRQAQKMEAVGQLTGGLAHDFNNLLAGIVGNLQMLRVRLGQGKFDDLSRYIDAAESVADRAAALTHRMLAFARRQTLAPQVVNVNALIESMEDLFRQTVGPQIAISLALESDAWSTHSDRNQLENALLNLVINARDAMPQGGQLTVSTHNVEVGTTPGSPEGDVPPGRYVTLSVTDTGTGMPPEVIRRAFDPFFTTKPIGQGTGLGLSMIFGFVRQSGGQIRIYSALGQGTTVRLYLPMHQGQPPSENSAAEAEDRSAARTATILLVEDEASLRTLLAEALDDEGYRVIEAGDSDQGLRELQSREKIEVLISDVGLPGTLNGRQLADAGRILFPDLKTILITGYVKDPEVRKSFEGANIQVLRKPFSLDVLKRKLASLLDGE